MDVNKKSAPQRQVAEIVRVGQWGRVEYQHVLECGHVEVRKRPSKTDKIACAWCVVASEKQRELRTLTIVPPPVEEEKWDFYDDTAVDEIKLAQIRSALAHSLGCPQENIEIVSSIDEEGNLSVNYVSVFLDFAQAQQIIRNSQKVVDIR
jgi:hypothetical protein